MITVLVVEDSPVAQELLVHLLTSDPDIRVIGRVSSGPAALEFLETQKPDVITMDIHMPGMDGFEVTRRIMETAPVPIVIVSASWDAADVQKTFRAFEAGAVAAIEKPRGGAHPEATGLADRLVQTVKAMAEVRVVRRWTKRASPLPVIEPAKIAARDLPEGLKLVAIGASTGGPPVLQTILSRLPEHFPAPILIVQHISRGFLNGMMDWLQQTTPLRVHIAQHQEPARPGGVYLAPDDCHMGIDRSMRIALTDEPAEHGLRPAAACLFRSVARHLGSNAAGILLTGMGRDGADELKLMRDAGAITFAQDAESSIVHGMPGEAIKLGAATYVLSPPAIAATLVSLAGRSAAGSADVLRRS